ncbi:MAG TPA: phosphatidylserine decarboxylase [Chitinophagales bacterium]|nr:phosphatidylserine decarboxylase [Chitinophagales bacterium]
MALRRVLTVVVLLTVFTLGYYRVWFLRQPERNIPNNNALIVSPANGRIVSISKWNSESLLVTKEKFGAINVWTKDVDTAGTIISIQMDVTNVHYQRAPVGGTVISEDYEKGSFHNAVRMSNEYGIRFENEHNAILLQAANGEKYKVIQIAGFLARRIIDYTHPGDSITQGQIIGLIKLGSQVTIILPHSAVVEAKTGDVTVDGETVLARFN